ncbi:hypothetical protein Lferr_2235 [Acidithiobacillus ferrooxidans ATCC 53993]|jgi:hypothetical protein|nr:hypothetical protein Lferr_2235 [Acidithiobacillus ferrooxidans ATCC 53993]EGQ63915.1 hypothetical protein GGI1_22379 [Acidithiobacillus sp. GGI-221]
MTAIFMTYAQALAGHARGDITEAHISVRKAERIPR